MYRKAANFSLMMLSIGGLIVGLCRDGGGSLNRTEIAVGLFKMGIWLSPPEVGGQNFVRNHLKSAMLTKACLQLGAMMGVLDEDGGGDVDYEEWNRFWNMHIDLLEGGTVEVDGETLALI